MECDYAEEYGCGNQTDDDSSNSAFPRFFWADSLIKLVFSKKFSEIKSAGVACKDYDKEEKYPCLSPRAYVNKYEKRKRQCHVHEAKDRLAKFFR